MKKNISKNNLFITFGIFFLGFVFIGNTLEDIYLSLIILFFEILILLNFYICIRKYLIIIFFIILGGLSGIFLSNYNYDIVTKKIDIIDKIVDNKYNIKAEITDINKIKEFEVEYKIKLLKILGTEGFTPLLLEIETKEKYHIEGLITIPSNFDLKVGDIIKFREKIRKIENFNDTFNYKKFSYSKNIYFKVNAGSINKIGEIDSNFIVDKIVYFRKNMLSKINNLYPKEEAVFLGGILFGARESMEQDLKTDFNNSGLTHFIAVSGFNITILVVFLSWLLKFFPSILKVLIITLSIMSFVVLVGDSVSVVRASIMGLFAYYISISGRSVHNLGLLVFVGIIMVFISPLSINYDISFALSFLAVLGILYFQEKINKLFYWLPDFMAIREAFVLTLSAMTFALPIILFNFGQLSIISPLANIAVTWTIPLAMIGGFLSLVVDYVYNGLSVWIGYFTWILLSWDIKIVHLFGRQDWAIIKFNPGEYKNIIQIIYFMILIFIINFFE